MKRLLVLTLALFTFLVAPTIPGLRTAHANPVKVVTTIPPVKAPSILDFLKDDDEEPAPTVTCQSDPKLGNKYCVPKYRFSDEVTEQTSKRFVKWVQAANDAGADAILFEINTPGGSVNDGFEMMKAIEDSKAPVTCVVDGNAESMGFGILQSCAHRYMTPRSKLMAHEPSLGGNMFGRPNEWQAIADMLKATRAQFEWQCQHRLSISMKDYQDHTQGGKMWFLLSDEAKKVSAIDGVVTTVKEQHDKMLK